MKFKPGSIVHYHPERGEDYTLCECIVRDSHQTTSNLPKEEHRWIYWLEGFHSIVAEEALSLSRSTPLDDLVLHVEIGDGSKWEIPAGLIGLNRARCYADEHGGDLLRSYLNDTVPLFGECHYEIADWVSNNMNWDEVFHYAKQIEKPSAPDYDHGLANGNKYVVRVSQ